MAIVYGVSHRFRFSQIYKRSQEESDKGIDDSDLSDDGLDYEPEVMITNDLPNDLNKVLIDNQYFEEGSAEHATKSVK